MAKQHIPYHFGEFCKIWVNKGQPEIEGYAVCKIDPLGISLFCFEKDNHVNLSWSDLFRKYKWDDGKPCGMRITEWVV